MEQHAQVIDPQVVDPAVTGPMGTDAMSADPTGADRPIADLAIPTQLVRDLGSSETETATETDDADRAGMDLLAAHVPLTLLLDLAGNDSPESQEILLHERPSADELAWIGSH